MARIPALRKIEREGHSWGGQAKEDSFQETIKLTLKEFDRLKTEPFENGALKAAKEQLKGQLLLNLESSESIMTDLAKEEIYSQRRLPVVQILKQIDDVTEEDVRYLANELRDSRNYCLAVLGPVNGIH